jgi:hypothetical protein
MTTGHSYLDEVPSYSLGERAGNAQEMAFSQQNLLWPALLRA